MSAVNSRRYRFARILLSGIGLVAVLSFLAAIGVSKLYWGYYLRPPSLDRRIREIERVISLTAVGSERRSDGSIRLVTNDTYSITDGLSRCRDGVPRIYYDCLSERILVALGDLGKLPASADRMPPEELATLYGELEATEMLRDGGRGCDQAKELTGIVLEAEGKEGQRYLFVGVDGGQVSNDHYPYYEFLFHLLDQDSGPVLLSCNRLFYDVAGLEGMEWSGAWLAFFLLGTVVVVLTVVVLFVINALQRKSSSTEEAG